MLEAVFQEQNDHSSEIDQGQILAANLDLQALPGYLASGENLPLKHKENRDWRANMPQKQAFEKVIWLFEANDDEQLEFMIWST